MEKTSELGTVHPSFSLRDKDSCTLNSECGNMQNDLPTVPGQQHFLSPAQDHPPQTVSSVEDTQKFDEPDAAALSPLASSSPSFCKNVKCFTEISVSKKDVKDCLIEYARSHPGFGKRFVRKMEIYDIATFSAYHYTLETFTESRESENTRKTYEGGNVNAMENGIPPIIWDIAQTPPKMFEFAVKNSEIPNTAFIKRCGVCDNIRRITCSFCRGSNTADCGFCKGKIKLFTSEICPNCKERSSCNKCNNVGRIVCRNCKGEGRFKFYENLKTIWRNHEENIVINDTRLPNNKLICLVGGEVAFRESALQVRPVDHFQDERIKKASTGLISKHKELSSERILQQRHQVRVIPIVQVQYCRKKKDGEFFVYGPERRIYFPRYRMISYCVML